MMQKLKNLYESFIESSKQGDLVGQGIALAIAAIVIVGVSIPITQNVIDDQNLTGITATVVSFVPVFLGLALLVGAASLMRSQQ